jgi:hypothetical protein
MIIDRIKNHDDPPEEHADDCQCSECRCSDIDTENWAYPFDWPKCPACGLPALDGRITCGSAGCNEEAWRR